jgi:hypothetical protein
MCCFACLFSLLICIGSSPERSVLPYPPTKRGRPEQTTRRRSGWVTLTLTLTPTATTAPGECLVRACPRLLLLSVVCAPAPSRRRIHEFGIIAAYRVSSADALFVYGLVAVSNRWQDQRVTGDWFFFFCKGCELICSFLEYSVRFWSTCLSAIGGSCCSS